MTVGLFAFSIRAFSVRREAKLFYYSFVIITLVGALSHFAMASGLGSMRQGDHIVFFARSIDWVITTPLLLLNVALIALPRVPERTQLIVVLLGADILMIITGSIGTFILSDGRWGWFGASTMGFVIIFYIIAQFTREAHLRGSEVSKLYSILSKWLIALFACYPIVLILGNERLEMFKLITRKSRLFALPGGRGHLHGRIARHPPVLHPHRVEQNFAARVGEADQRQDRPAERRKQVEQGACEPVKTVSARQGMGQQRREVFARQQPFVDDQDPPDPAYLHPTSIPHLPKAGLLERWRVLVGWPSSQELGKGLFEPVDFACTRVHTHPQLAPLSCSSTQPLYGNP